MKHIRFMNNGEKICDNPARLDLWDSPVMVDFEPAEAESCKICPGLLIAHNQRAFEQETNERVMRIQRTNPPPVVSRGLLYGIIFSSLVWAVLFVLWVVFY